MINWSAYFTVLLCLFIEYGIPFIFILLLLGVIIACGYLIYDKLFNTYTDDEYIEEIKDTKISSNEE